MHTYALCLAQTHDNNNNSRSSNGVVELCNELTLSFESFGHFNCVYDIDQPTNRPRYLSRCERNHFKKMTKKIKIHKLLLCVDESDWIILNTCKKMVAFTWWYYYKKLWAKHRRVCFTNASNTMPSHQFT